MSDILSRFPQLRGHPLAMAMMAGVLRDRGSSDDAFALGLAAVEAAPEDMEVRDFVRAILSRGVAKWHVPMLHDGPRNHCYALAIQRLVQPGMTVLEIGSGAGLLSLLAAQAGAQVVTCEKHPMVAASAAFIAERNGLADRIRVIPKLSSELEIGIDLPKRADLLMSELFDDTLYGDGIVEFITDARERLLKPEAILVPRRAELRLALASFDVPDKHYPLEMVEGFDLTAFNILAPPPAGNLRSARDGAVQRSDPVSALAVDFMNAPPFGDSRTDLSIRSSGGTINGVAQWLRVDFGDEIQFENNPFAGPKSHWGSPLYPLHEAIETRPGEMLEIMVRRAERIILMKVNRPPLGAKS